MEDKQEKQNLEDDSMFHEKKETTEENITNETDEPTEKNKTIEETNSADEIEAIEEDENSALKKYIVQISREFVPLIDSMTVDERIAYINDCIQTKLDWDKQQTVKSKKIQLVVHFLIFITVFVFCTPFAIYGVNKAIMMTFENYKYSQENFEKLYKQRFEKDKAYMRSIEYNKKHSIK